MFLTHIVKILIPVILLCKTQLCLINLNSFYTDLQVLSIVVEVIGLQRKITTSKI